MFGNFLQNVIAQAAVSKSIIPGGVNTSDSGITDWQGGFMNLGVIVAAILVPFLLSKFLSNKLRMQTHVSSFFWILLALLSTVFILGAWLSGIKSMQLPLGPDIVGGTSFIYEIDRSSAGKGEKVVAKSFLVPLANRLNPSGTKEYIIRPIGDDQIEIIIPAVDEAEKDYIKKQITNAGNLQFQIVANANDHQDIITQANAQANDSNQTIRMRRDVTLNDKTTGEPRVAGVWRTLGRGQQKDGVLQITGYSTGDVIRNAATGRLLNPPPVQKANDFEKWLKAQNIDNVDILLALEKAGTPYTEVNGGDLTRASKEVSKGGGFGYEVHFKMSVGGAAKMLSLTGANQPSPTSDFKRRMAILLDGVVKSAPSLNSPIRGEGMIEGRFSEDEVDFLVNVLNGGALPGSISKAPISENSVGANMGMDAIAKGFYASGISLLVTILCVLVYYRFSGLIATIALLLNLGMILACMILIKQPLTLSGIAGLVLSVGMSVDANVLVFERIREETEKKATARMAIRNGFDRAWTTIFDSNLTTLITAVVLYFVGTEQIKGFSITLIIGLVISLFTAVFVTHKIFEVAEKLKCAFLGMSDYVNTGKRALFGAGDIDFMGYRFIAYSFSAFLIVLGLVATSFRGRQILDIDFNGGTSVVFTLDNGAEADTVRTVVSKAFDVDAEGLPIQTSLTSVDMSGYKKGSVFKLDVSIKDGKDVEKRLLKGFGDGSDVKLITYDVEVKPSGKASGLVAPKQDIKLVSFQDNTAQEKTPPVSAEVATTSDIKEGEKAAPAPVDDTLAKTSVQLAFNNSVGEGTAKMNASQVSDALVAAAQGVGQTLNPALLELIPMGRGAEDWNPESGLGFREWTVGLPFDLAVSQKVTDRLRETLKSQPVFQSMSKIESRVAGEMQQRALAGLLLSFVFITAYIWFRFQRIAYGIAAVIALVHDVFITLTFIAVSHWLFKPLGFMLIEDFKISLTTVAGFLTIIGYSLNDTIVVFDRIREVKGKSPNLTEKMINASVTQTLSRTLLTSSTTIIAILLMYTFGGEAIHGFAYCLFIGILVGTYSSIFIAAPILIWFMKREQAAKNAAKVAVR